MLTTPSPAQTLPSPVSQADRFTKSAFSLRVEISPTKLTTENFFYNK